MPARRKANSVSSLSDQRRNRRAGQRVPGAPCPPPEGVLRDDDDPRVIEAWEAWQEHYGPACDRAGWVLLTGAVHCLRLYYEKGRSADLGAVRTTLRDVDYSMDGRLQRPGPAGGGGGSTVKL